MVEPIVVPTPLLRDIPGGVAVIGSDEVDYLVVFSVPAFGLGHDILICLLKRGQERLASLALITINLECANHF